MNIRPALALLCMTALTGLVPLLESSAQSVPDREHWGERFNSPGAELTYREIGRARLQDKTVVTYNLFALGLPKDGRYVLSVLNVGSEPRAAADAYLTEEGKVVSAIADPARHIVEDPINVKTFGGKGEPIQFALISDDGHLRAFAQIVPFPIRETSGPCQLSAIETGPYYYGMFIRVTGFKPNEEMAIEQRSENEGAETKARADDKGGYYAGFFPFVNGKRSGKARFYITAKSCKIGIEFPWGEGSYQYQ